jgi:hypothetical protein
MRGGGKPPREPMSGQTQLNVDERDVEPYALVMVTVTLKGLPMLQRAKRLLKPALLRTLPAVDHVTVAAKDDA